MQFRKSPIPRSQNPLSTLHALVIGINTYPHAQLKWATQDADSIDIFLRDDLAVPESQISNLRNEQATRCRILAEIDKLRNDPHIAPFDPIVIYYAGHGSEVDSPAGKHEKHAPKTQCLVPWDTGMSAKDEKPIPPIPDYTLAGLLNALAAKKGNNITVILDCCHSASSTRGARELPYKVPADCATKDAPRSASELPGSLWPHDAVNWGSCQARRLAPNVVPALSSGLDEEILRRATGLSSNSTNSFPNRSIPRIPYFGRSHILLAACGHAEVAYESSDTRSGCFTAALLGKLRSSRLHKLTYKACFEDFPGLVTPSGTQNPVCEGDHTERLFFHIVTPGPLSPEYFIPAHLIDDEYTLKVGVAQGVIPGSTYGIYPNEAFEDDQTSPLQADEGTYYGTVQMPPIEFESKDPCQTQCFTSMSGDFPPLAYAKLLKRGQGALFSIFLTETFQNVTDFQIEPDQGMNQVHSQSEAAVVLDADREGRVAFHLTQAPSISFPKVAADINVLRYILFAMAQWEWHVARSPDMSYMNNEDMAQLCLYRLGESQPEEVPMDDEDGSVNVISSPRALYGIKIVNNSRRRLYPYLFYFSANNQSICPLFLKVHGSGVIDAPLEPNSELTMGYGNDDMISGPLIFELPEDIGYLRLFWTTTPGDFDSMIQRSSFEGIEHCAMTLDKTQFVEAIAIGAQALDGEEVECATPLLDQQPTTIGSYSSRFVMGGSVVTTDPPTSPQLESTPFEQDDSLALEATQTLADQSVPLGEVEASYNNSDLANTEGMTGRPVSQSDPPVVIPSPGPGSKPPIHALVIGINAYTDKPLTGAVPDAKRFIDYLQKKLGVPGSQITDLLNADAKREAIIKGFQNLAKPDNGINLGDPIVIFYAGHGSEGPPPDDRTENGTVQSIVAVDSGNVNNVPSIPDYVIGRLLWDISQAKGDNITVIFDCCHSASGTRDVAGSRFLDPGSLPKFPKGLGKDILSAPLPASESRESVDPLSLGVAYPLANMSPHVLLAACGHAELAWERDSYGTFSTALLDLLEGRDINSMTYTWCMQHIPKLNTSLPQHPVCEGKNTQRIFFNSKVPGADSSFILIKTDAQGVHLQAGSAQGITPQSQFEVYANHVLGVNNPPLGIFEVESVQPFQSTLKRVEPPNLDLVELTYGRQVAYGKEQVMRVFMTPEFQEAAKPDEDWLKLFSGSQTGVPIIPVEHSEGSDLIVSYEAGETTFTTTNRIASRHEIQKLPTKSEFPNELQEVPATPGEVNRILVGLSRWNWHVNRTPGRRPFQASVKMEFFQLKKSDSFTSEGQRVVKPVGNNLNFNGLANVVVGGQGTPAPDGESYYGFNIRHPRPQVSHPSGRLLHLAFW